MKTHSCWKEAGTVHYPAVATDHHANALIIGGGITGVTAAYLLAKADKSVILLEKNVLCQGETGHTTAHITYPTDIRLTELVKDFGEDHAQAIWDAHQAAAQQIAANVEAEGIDCELRHVPGYLYAASQDPEEAQQLNEEAQLAARLGFDAHYVGACPVTGQPAIVFANMMKMHPLRYVSGLAQKAAAAGALLFENSEAGEFGDDGHSVICNGHRITYDHVFLATHVPLQGNTGTLKAALLQTKLAAYSTYAIGARLAKDAAPEALWWDTSDPYLYLRIDHHADGAYAILGGEDHKTGQETETDKPYEALISKLHTLFPNAEVDHRWSGQVIETADGLPYIGDVSGQFIATGYSGTGTTFGTLGAMMFTDYVLGIRNPWTDLYSVNRKKLSGAWDYLKENSDYPYYLVKGLFRGKAGNPDSLLCGEGKIIRHEGKKMAAYRDDAGQLTLLSPICPHMGCVVNWNSAEKTWDCPCHGSRFTSQGEVIAGPAESPLEKAKV